MRGQLPSAEPYTAALLHARETRPGLSRMQGLMESGGGAGLVYGRGRMARGGEAAVSHAMHTWDHFCPSQISYFGDTNKIKQ